MRFVSVQKSLDEIAADMLKTLISTYSRVMKKNIWILGITVGLGLIFPFFLNWILLQKAFVPVVGDSVTF